MHPSTGDRARKIRALLDKAEATSYPAEAEALTAKAGELMSQWQISDAMLAAAGPVADRTQIVTRDVELGKGPYLNARLALLAAAGHFQHCRVLTSTGWSGRIGHVVGFVDDVERAEMLYTSLLVQSSRAVTAAPGPPARSGVNTTSWRRDFLLGYAHTTGERLSEARERAVDDAEATAATAPGPGGSVALVLADRDAELDAWIARSYGRVGRARGTFHSSTGGWEHGRAAGTRADLSTGTRLGGRSRSLTR